MSPKAVTIIGQGYVGLPLAQAAAGSGIRVYGFDLSQKIITSLSMGLSHVDDLSDADVREMISQGYVATDQPNVISESEVVVICVPTPLSEGGSPDLTAVKAASHTVGKYIKSGSTVILESTTYPGTTEDVVKPILEAESGLAAGSDFSLAYSPERVDPGSKVYGIRNTPKLVGGINDSSTRAAIDFYREFVDTPVWVTGLREAETAKLLENTFRHVNIALVNEMAKFCHELRIDIWEVIQAAATKPFGFMKFTPGPGVGGHCIPIDPNYLSYEVRNQLGYPFRFVELAQEVNNSMPQYVVDRAAELLNDQRKPLNGSVVLLIGVTYKANIGDQRESPAVPVAELIKRRGGLVEFHDPLVDEWNVDSQKLSRVENLDVAADSADIVVLLQDHESYDFKRIAKRSKLLLDTRGVAPRPAVHL